MKFLWIAITLISSSIVIAQQPIDDKGDQRAKEVRLLRQELARISARLDSLEKEDGVSLSAASPDTASSPAAPQVASVGSPHSSLLQPEDTRTLSFFRDTTINFGIDGYYGYNFNHPLGRVNLLRSYDVTSNSFSINQASIMVEHLPTALPDNRFGGRLDLQYGQATETLQGASANEQRPQVWRNVFQAYGSYLAPIGTGLQLDFGKFASSLGVEGNYTKDQVAYSRAYSFNFLPYYHMGLRANYNLIPKINFAYWLVNGAQQTEDFNGFKSQGFLFTLKPASSVSWNINYYFGQEQRDVLQTLNPTFPASPTQPGLPTTNISPAPNGRNHIFDTYATWTATPRLKLIGEADYVISRVQAQSTPAHAAIGSVYARYKFFTNWNAGARFEYFDDRGALFSGTVQALKELTLVMDHQITPGFLVRGEYRRDFSNRPFFLTSTPNVLSPSQTTATLGLVYWWGTKQGSW